MIAARRAELLTAFAEKIGAHAFVADARDETQVAALAQAALERFERIDVAVNAAGAPVRSSVAQATQALLQEALDLNYLAHVYFIKHMALAMERDGSIIVISSMSGTCVTDGTVFPYSCAKAATNCLVQCAAIEYGPRNIRVNAILPGPIESAASRGLFKNAPLRQAFEKEVPLGRIAQPEDLADAALWLAGPAFVTGLNLQVNGGMFLSRFPTPSELPGGAAAYQKRPG
ncbi:MAG TPA: SDR family oxidoreductase [Steroidobacteraceae bacterium]|nr:SDR family oxidoreductase [Steroidobacteraceae bacterium]